MKLKSAPTLGPRYWTTMLIASVCGTNFGDFFPDVLRLGAVAGLISLAALFVAVALIDRRLEKAYEGRYWALILIVRAAATNIADLVIQKQHLGYLTASVVLALTLVGLKMLHDHASPPPTEDRRVTPTGLYWLSMLTAGALGTLVGDGIGHAFGAVSKGVPISAGIATGVLMLLYFTPRGGLPTSVEAYWPTIVIVRWWGTNVGDILAFLLSLPVSLLGTGAVLALVIYCWPATKRTKFKLGHGREPT